MRPNVSASAITTINPIRIKIKITDERNQNQITRKDAKNCFVESLNDVFAIGKVHLNFAAYDSNKPARQRQTAGVHIFIVAYL